MDCLRNLTSCGGCTRKHARCHWKDVSRQEVEAVESFSEGLIITAENASVLNASAQKPRSTTVGTEDDEDEGHTPLDDLEELSRQNRAEDEESIASITRAAVTADSRPASQQPGDRSTTVFDEEGLERARQLARVASSQQEESERDGVSAAVHYEPAFDSPRAAAEERTASSATRYPDHHSSDLQSRRITQAQAQAQAAHKKEQLANGGWNTVNSRAIEGSHVRASGMIYENGH